MDFLIPSETWQPRANTRPWAHGFASPPSDGFAIIEDEEDARELSTATNGARPLTDLKLNLGHVFRSVKFQNEFLDYFGPRNCSPRPREARELRN